VLTDDLALVSFDISAYEDRSTKLHLGGIDFDQEWAGTRGPRVLIISPSPPFGGARATNVLLLGGDDHGSCAK
jgi:hypothetical protein